jgi:hypothetical protein
MCRLCTSVHRTGRALLPGPFRGAMCKLLVLVGRATVRNWAQACTRCAGQREREIRTAGRWRATNRAACVSPIPPRSRLPASHRHQTDRPGGKAARPWLWATTGERCGGRCRLPPPSGQRPHGDPAASRTTCTSVCIPIPLRSLLVSYPGPVPWRGKR